MLLSSTFIFFIKKYSEVSDYNLTVLCIFSQSHHFLNFMGLFIEEGNRVIK